MGWIGCVHFEKFQCNFVAQTFALIRPVLYRVSEGNQTVPNAHKWYEMHRNMSLGSNGGRSGAFVVINSDVTSCHELLTSSECFARSFVRQLNGPKCTQMVQNAPKHEFRVPWGGSGAFVAENSDATSWHELLH